jgi:hypothetical protein
LSAACLGAQHEQHPALIADIDVSSGPEVSTNGADPFQPVPHINFVSDTELAISAVDSRDTPLTAHNSHRDTPMHLLVDWYTVKGSSLVRTRQDKIAATSVHDSITTLPSGRSLVNADRKISVYSAEHDLLVSKSVEEICGTEAKQPEGSFYDSYEYAASEDIGVINLLWQYPTKSGFVDEHGVLHKPEPTASERSFYCWFRTDDLTSVRTIAALSYGLSASASGLAFYSGSYAKSLASSGWQPVSPPSGCQVPAGMIDMRKPYLLRSGDGVATTCAGQLIVEGQDGQRSIKLSFGGGLPIILTDAWKAPVLVLASGNVRLGHFSQDSTFHETEKLEIINYEIRDIAFLPKLTTEVNGQIFVGKASAVGLSPTGKYVAVLHGSRLAVYAINVAAQTNDN